MTVCTHTFCLISFVWISSFISSLSLAWLHMSHSWQQAPPSAACDLNRNNEDSGGSRQTFDAQMFAWPLLPYVQKPCRPSTTIAPPCVRKLRLLFPRHCPLLHETLRDAELWPLASSQRQSNQTLPSRWTCWALVRWMDECSDSPAAILYRHILPVIQNSM